jgi:hypothetical protein
MMRFGFGSVGTIVTPAQCNLDELDHGKMPLFRIKVVDQSLNHRGRLLALALNVQPADTQSGTDGRQYLLPLKYSDLGERIWDLTELNGDSRPTLVINSRIPGLAERILADPILQGAIFPTVVNNVMDAILFGTLDSEIDWVLEWRDFASTLIGEALPESAKDDDRDELLSRIVDAFVNRIGFAMMALPPQPFGSNDD